MRCLHVYNKYNNNKILLHAALNEIPRPTRCLNGHFSREFASVIRSSFDEAVTMRKERFIDIARIVCRAGSM